jgi:hypothetical protein
MVLNGSEIAIELRRSVRGECCSSSAFANCKFAGSTEGYLHCGAEAFIHAACPYSAVQNFTYPVYGEEI